MPYIRVGNPWINGAAPYLSAENLTQIEDGIAAAMALAEGGGGGGGSGLYGSVALDSFAGASDDAKLTAALSYCAAQTYIPAVALPTTRRPTFTAGGRTLFSGLKIIGGPGGNRNPELASGKYISSVISLQCGSGASSWFVGSGSIYNVYMGNFGVQMGSSAQFMDVPASGGTLYSCRFESLSFDLGPYVFGRPGAPTGFTQVELAGHWTIQNVRNQAITIGGSDNQLWFDGYVNIGTGQSAALAGDNTRFYIQFSGLSNTQVGMIYASGLNGYNCLRVTGNSDGLDFYGGVYEGYKPSGTAADGTHTLANPGNVVRLEGGAGAFFGGNFGQAMAQPPAGHNGTIEVTAGEWNFHSPTFYKGSTAETVPMIYRSGSARVAVFGATRRQAETWSARPGYKANSGGSFDVYPPSAMTAL